jgi:Acetyltransferase (GNAT) domain
MEFFRVAPAPSDEEWSRTMVRHRASALHHPAIHRGDNAPDSFQYLSLRHGSEEIGCALAIEQRQRKFRLPFGGDTKLVLPSAPAIDAGVDCNRARSALLDYAGDAHRLIVQPASSEWLVGDEDLAPHRHGAIVEFVMSLEDDLDTVRSTFHKVHRKNARRAVNKGVEIVEDSSIDGLLQLRDMQLASAERASERDNAFAVRDERYFRQVQQEVYATGLGHVFMARLDGAPIAALAWLQLGDRAQTVRSGSKAAGYQNYAMYALYDAVVERLIAEGVHELNAGGVPAEASEEGHPQHGLYEFKKGYGGTPRLRYGLEIPPQKDRSR